MNKFSQSAAVRVVGAALVVGGFLAACTPSQSKSAPAHPAVHQAQTSDTLMQGLGLAGQGALFSMPDPKHPQWLLCKLSMKIVNYSGNHVIGQGVTAILFEKGKRSGIMTAPKATGDIRQDTIIATGGVSLITLAPSGRSLHAHTVTWNAKTKLGKAYGDVHYRDSHTGVTGISPVLYFDSGLKKLSNVPLPEGS